MDRTQLCTHAARVVIKVGSSTLTHANGRLHLERLDRLARQLTDLRSSGKDVILVSSGAVAAGLGRLGINHRPKSMPERQAAAAVGQGLLMQIYAKSFAEYDQVIAQVLLTREDLDHRLRYLNARNTLLTLLGYGVIPVVNENDTVATEELKMLYIGDNDTLSALVASVVGADLLILLSDVDAVYDKNPREYPDAKKIAVIAELTPEILAGAGGAGSSVGTGGMATKMEAARIATCSGTAMVLADGSSPGVISQIISGENIGTLFLPKQDVLLERQRWIAFAGCPVGEVKVDHGAAEALIGQGKSLLSSGILEIQGEFHPGDLVRIIGPDGAEIARGLSNYGSDELQRIKGRKSSEIAGILGYKHYDEAVHRNNLVCLQERH